MVLAAISEALLSLLEGPAMLTETAASADVNIDLCNIIGCGVIRALEPHNHNPYHPLA